MATDGSSPPPLRGCEERPQRSTTTEPLWTRQTRSNREKRGRPRCRPHPGPRASPAQAPSADRSPLWAARSITLPFCRREVGSTSFRAARSITRSLIERRSPVAKGHRTGNGGHFEGPRSVAGFTTYNTSEPHRDGRHPVEKYERASHNAYPTLLLSFHIPFHLSFAAPLLTPAKNSTETRGQAENGTVLVGIKRNRTFYFNATHSFTNYSLIVAFIQTGQRIS